MAKCSHLFIFKNNPEAFENSLITSIVTGIWFSFCKKRVVSSASCVMANYCPMRVIPFTALDFIRSAGS